MIVLRFFFNDTATTEIYTLSLHDALPIWRRARGRPPWPPRSPDLLPECTSVPGAMRSEEHTSELQSHVNLVCRLLLEKKKATSILLSDYKITLPLIDMGSELYV